jgi:hypothetical protein
LLSIGGRDRDDGTVTDADALDVEATRCVPLVAATLPNWKPSVATVGLFSTSEPVASGSALPSPSEVVIDFS